MRFYLDSSAVLKRIFREAESPVLLDTLERWLAEDGFLVASSLAWVEVGRALMRRVVRPGGDELLSDAFDEVYEQYVNPEVLGLARRVNPKHLRSLDAIHLASALLLDVDSVVTYDERLASACAENNLATIAPGR